MKRAAPQQRIARGRTVRRSAATAPIKLLLVAAVAAALGTFAGVSATWHRLSAVSDMWLAALGSIATTAAAGFAPFRARPARSVPLLAFVALPAAVLCVGASGLGCMRGVLLPGTIWP